MQLFVISGTFSPLGPQEFPFCFPSRVASALASTIIRQFSWKSLQPEGEVRIMDTILLISLALSDLNHDTLNLKLGLQQVAQTCVSPLTIPNDVLLRA